jgi:hypothetical protein
MAIQNNRMFLREHFYSMGWSVAMRVASPKFSACDLREHSQRILRLKAVDRKVRREPNRARREFYKTTKCSCRNIVENLAGTNLGQHIIPSNLDPLDHFRPNRTQHLVVLITIKS